MDFKTLPLLALLAVPGLAKEKWQVGLGFNTTESDWIEYVGSNPTSLTNLKRDRRTVPSLQVGYQIKDFGHSDLSLTAEYQFKSGYDLNLTRLVAGAGGVDGAHGKMTKSYFAPGVMWNFHPTVDIGLGLQYRFERLQGEIASIDTHTNYNRPWLNLYLGYTFQNQSKVKPFVALRSSAALMTTNAPGYLSDLNAAWGQNKLLRSMAGDYESSIQVGVRF
jgi:hypothetical protein